MKTRFRYLLVLTIQIVITSQLLNARSYFLSSNNGSDKNNGESPEMAWKSLDAFNSRVFAPRDSIFFECNSVWQGQLKPKGNGRYSKPIVIDKFGQGKLPRIDGDGKVSEVVYLYNVKYLEINNLEITNKGKTREAGRTGVHVHADNIGTLHGIRLNGLYIHDINGSNVKMKGEGFGILWNNTGKDIPSRFDGLIIENCRLYLVDRNGIRGKGSFLHRDKWYPNLNVVIRNNYLEDIGGDGIVVIGCDGALVEYNTIKYARMRAKDYAAGIWPWASDNTLFQFNEVSHVKGILDGQGFDCDYNCKNTIFQYNYSHDNEGGFMLIIGGGGWRIPKYCGNISPIVRNNVSINDGKRIFHLIEENNDCQIYGNFIYTNKNIPLFLISWHQAGAGYYIHDNTFFAGDTLKYGYGNKKQFDENGEFLGFDYHPGFPEEVRIVMIDNKFIGNHTIGRNAENEYFDDDLILKQKINSILLPDGFSKPGIQVIWNFIERP